MIARRHLLAVASAAVGAPARASGEGARPIRVPNVTLLDQDGHPRSLVSLLRGRASLVSFFFTGCGTTCPLQTDRLMALQDHLSGARAASPLLLSISLDPLGDDPAAMREYAARFGLRLGDAAACLMLTGAPAVLSPVWAAFDAPRDRPENHATLFWLSPPGSAGWLPRSIHTPTADLAATLTAGAS